MIHINRLGKFDPDPGSSKPSSSTQPTKDASGSAAPMSATSAKIAEKLTIHPMLGISIGIGFGLVVGYLLKRR